MKAQDLRLKIKEAVDNEWLLPDQIRWLILNKLAKRQKEVFTQIVIDEVTRSINEELDADYDAFRGWK
ncbi:hypothetical protein RHO15_09755 [Utexia brackfieldae]|uniref:hypothetical protein n=1 Tax=Utexia brackfieldae TaxID=3074108 RepID=UPI00370D7071